MRGRKYELSATSRGSDSACSGSRRRHSLQVARKNGTQPDKKHHEDFYGSIDSCKLVNTNDQLPQQLQLSTTDQHLALLPLPSFTALTKSQFYISLSERSQLARRVFHVVYSGWSLSSLLPKCLSLNDIRIRSIHLPRIRSIRYSLGSDCNHNRRYWLRDIACV